MSKTNVVVLTHFLWYKIFPSARLMCSFEPKEVKEEERQKERKRKERLATIFSAAVACLPASQPGSQPVHHEASHPPSKQANRSISFTGATGMGPSNATKQRATVLHHFPSERPSRPQPLITRHCQSAARRGLHHTGLFTAFCYSLNPVSRGRVLFQLSWVSTKGAAHKKENKLNPSNSIFN